MDKDILNEAQRRRVSITFAMVEKELLEVEELIQSGRRAGILYEIENDVPDEIEGPLIEKINSIREKIDNIKAEFSLHKETMSLTQKLGSKLSLLSVDVEEIESKRLKGYGEIAEGLKESLDPRLSEIKEEFYNMLKLLRG